MCVVFKEHGFPFVVEKTASYAGKVFPSGADSTLAKPGSGKGGDTQGEETAPRQPAEGANLHLKRDSVRNRKRDG